MSVVNAPLARDGAPVPTPGVAELPTPRRIRMRLLRAWLVGLLFFGYGPAFTYGVLAWLLNDTQWAWTYLMYFTLVPLVGGCGVLLLPWRWYRPIGASLGRWNAGAAVEPAECAAVYTRALQLPWKVALGAFAAAAVGYLVGTSIVHLAANQPWEEIAKTMPAIPLVGGMMGAFCYYGTTRALYPVVAWCSRRLVAPLPVRHVPMGLKFFTTTCILGVAVLSLLLPAAYTLGQVVTEEHLQDRALTHLRVGAQQMGPFRRLEDRMRIVQKAALGKYGYVFAVDEAGRIATPHPQGFQHLDEERFARPARHLVGYEGVWVDRVGQHRVVAFVHPAGSLWTFVSVTFPRDFDAPLRHFLFFSFLIAVEVLVVILVFGRYYTKSITTPLAELTSTTERIARYGNLTERVPVTTNDELSDLARAFNRMVEELQTSKADLQAHTRELERTTQELRTLNQEMEDLLHVVSHDLRAPLINIQGFSSRLRPLMQEAVKMLEELAAQQPANGPRAQAEGLTRELDTRMTESLRFISKGVEKMDALLSSLLAISRVGRKADPIQPNDLNTILDDVLETFAHQLKDHGIEIIRQPLPARVPCRRNEINQVLSNLVSNAISYMGASERRFIEIGGDEAGDAVEFYVQDTGVGIAQEDQARVFQMFTRLQTVNVPGEGIGLAYVRKIVRSHGGSVRVESQRGRGSRFIVTLPRSQPVVTRG